jgi:hypothetical protein
MELPLNLYNPQLYSAQKDKKDNTAANKTTTSKKMFRSQNQIRNAEKQLGNLNLETATHSTAAANVTTEIPPLPQKHQPTNDDFSFAEEPTFAQHSLDPFMTSQGETTTLNNSNTSYDNLKIEPFKKPQQQQPPKKLPPKKPEYVRRIASDDEDCKSYRILLLL